MLLMGRIKEILVKFAQNICVDCLQEATQCVRELSSENHHHFVYNSINHVLERSSQSRKQAGHLLHDLVHGSVISVESYIKG